MSCAACVKYEYLKCLQVDQPRYTSLSQHQSALDHPFLRRKSPNGTQTLHNQGILDGRETLGQVRRELQNVLYIHAGWFDR